VCFTFLTKRSRIAYCLGVARAKAFNREEALKKAMVAFWRCGYEATSVQDLVDAMGINRQSLYDTFGDKHELYLEVLEHYRCGEAQSFLTPLNEQKPLRQRLENMFDLMIEESVNDPDRKGCLIANATLELANQDKAVYDFVEKNFQNSVKNFETLLSVAKAKGELSAEKNIKALAVFIVNTIGGLRVTAKASPDKAVLKSIVKTTLVVFE
jgi:TetR/AcrR family transcriptional regulator, transcriptional repressor for nem operon